MLTRNSKTK